MTSHYVVSAIRRHWLLVPATTILGGFFAAVYAFTATPEYAASTKMFIAAQPPVSPDEAYTGSQFASSRMASYVDLVTGHALAARTVERRHLGIAADDLARKVSATVNPGSVIVKLSITDSSPEAARDLANALSEDFVQMVQELEPDPRRRGRGSCDAHPAADDAHWISPDRRRIVPLGTADWHTDLNDPAIRDYIDGGKQFAELMDRKAISRDDTVVIYGDKSNWWAAYALWKVHVVRP